MSLAESLRDYLALSWAVIPLVDRKPLEKDFGDRPLTSPTLPRDADGLGLLPSRSNLVDIDCDTDEMVQAAALILPDTACYGHSGRVRHYIYAYVGDEPHFENFKEGEFRAGKTKSGGHDRYSVLPPTESKHGTPTHWVRPPSELASLPTGELAYLYARCSLTAKLARLAKPHERHELHLEIAGTCIRLGWPEEHIRALVSDVCAVSNDPDVEDRQAAISSSLARFANDESMRELGNEHKLGKIFDRISELRGWSAGGEDPGLIKLTGVARDDIAAMSAALVKDPTLYSRGGQLVRVRDVDGAPVVEPHDRYTILGPLAQYAPTTRKMRFGLRRVDPDETTINALLRAPSWPGVRVLTDVLTSPALRADGGIVDTPGHDASSGVLLWELPDKPLSSFEVGTTRAEGKAAIRALLELIADFPLDDHSRCVWLGLLFTLAARPLIPGPVPMFTADAPSGGSGKSLLLKLAGLIATGVEPASTAAPSTDEARKTLYAAAASGRPMLLFDNCDRRSPESDALEQAVTAGSISTRLMRRDAVASVPFRCVVAISGNNVSFSDTMERRNLRMRLRAVDLNDVARATSFREQQLEQHVKIFSPRYLGYVLTAVRAFLLARAQGAEGPKTHILPSFEGWSALIPRCLAWYGLPDIVAGSVEERTQAQASEDWRDMCVELVGKWCATLPREACGEFRARQLWARLNEGSFGSGPRELRDSLEATLGRPLKTATDVGKALAKLRDLPTGPRGFERVLRGRVDRNGVVYWRCEGPVGVLAPAVLASGG